MGRRALKAGELALLASCALLVLHVLPVLLEPEAPPDPTVGVGERVAGFLPDAAELATLPDVAPGVAPPGALCGWAYARSGDALGRDAVWIPRAEVDALLRGEVAPSLQLRLVASHLRDTTTAGPAPVTAADVVRARLFALPTADGAGTRIAIWGSFRIVQGVAGYDGTLAGELVADAGGVVTRLALLARGEAWAGDDRRPLAVAIVDDPTAARRLPTAAATDRARYLADGVPSPR